MSIQLIIVIVIIALFVWYFKQNTPVPHESGPLKEDVVDAVEQPILSERFTAVPESTQQGDFGYDLATNKLRIGSEVLEGSKTLIVWDSKRVNELRKRFQVMQVLDRVEFRQGTNVIEVYRAVSDKLSTYVFPRADSDDEIVELKTEIPEDTTKSPYRQKPNLDVFKKQEILIPADMIETIRALETTYSTRQASSGPKAIDTHSSPV